jgi:hypothetical protein
MGQSIPHVAIALNDLALLLQATNRFADAELLMRRVVRIFLTFTNSTGHIHFNLRAAFENYIGLLEAMELSDEVTQRLQDLAGDVGFDEASYDRLIAELFQ